ncbi:hypothetical protein ACS5NO_03825 [Larkinella sp. GY13]|uniref:hypothetical protein n=1 Tax=Larkinella sp. GY13 TaxID=3453720 RepID=UPI003EEE4875
MNISGTFFRLPVAVRRFVFGPLTLAGFLVLMTGACKKETDPAPVSNSPITLFTSPSNPLVARIDNKADGILELYGTKNAAGVTQQLTMLVHQMDPSSKDATYLLLDEQSRLKTILGQDGSKIALKWQTESRATVTYISADGENQVNTEIDLDEEITGGRLAAPAINPVFRAGSGTSVRNNQPLRLRQEFANDAVSIPSGARKAAGQQEVTINLTNCGGLPSDAEYVSVIMYKSPASKSNRVGEFKAHRVTKGMYSVILPTDVSAEVNLSNQDICKGVGKVFDKILCNKVTKVLRKVGSKAPKATPWTLIGGFILDKGLGKLCEITTPEGELCKANFEDEKKNYWIGNVLFIAKAVPTSGGEPRYSRLTDPIDGKASYPDLSVELGAELKVQPLALSPDRPVAQQSYVARASIHCVPVNSRVSLRVVGTDSYTDEVSTVVYSLDANGAFNFSLTIPGAKTSGIQDEIKLTVTLPDGKVITKTASLIFG